MTAFKLMLTTRGCAARRIEIQMRKVPVRALKLRSHLDIFGPIMGHAAGTAVLFLLQADSGHRLGPDFLPISKSTC
jgi:hypothetical protein